jgi:hypothetical protein
VFRGKYTQKYQCVKLVDVSVVLVRLITALCASVSA